jgi:hypothetical protein
VCVCVGVCVVRVCQVEGLQTRQQELELTVRTLQGAPYLYVRHTDCTYAFRILHGLGGADIDMHAALPVRYNSGIRIP